MNKYIKFSVILNIILSILMVWTMVWFVQTVNRLEAEKASVMDVTFLLDDFNKEHTDTVKSLFEEALKGFEKIE